jgi:hypothetical protein
VHFCFPLSAQKNNDSTKVRQSKEIDKLNFFQGDFESMNKKLNHICTVLPVKFFHKDSILIFSYTNSTAKLNLVKDGKRIGKNTFLTVGFSLTVFCNYKIHEL